MMTRVPALLVWTMVACAGRTGPEKAQAPEARPSVSAQGGSTTPSRLTRGSQRLVRSLSSSMRVEAYVSSGTPELERFARDLSALLDEYARASQGKLDFELVDVGSDDARQRAKDAGIAEQRLGDQTPVAFIGLAFHYGGQGAILPQLALDAEGGLEFWISTKIRELRSRAEGIHQRIGVVSSKQELKLTDRNLVPRVAGDTKAPSLNTILKDAFPFYELEEIDLKGGSAGIDSGLLGLIVTQPRADYDERELARIDEFLMAGGKSLAVFASAVTLEPGDTTLSAKLSTHGLDKLLGPYGIQMNSDAVLDPLSSFHVAVATQSGSSSLRHPGLAHLVSERGASSRLDATFPSFFRMAEVMFPFPSSLTLDPQRQPDGVKLRELAYTSSESWAVTKTPIDLRLGADFQAKEPRGRFLIAASSEGTLKSAFTDARAPKTSRVLVVSSSQFLTNPFAQASNDAAAPDLVLSKLAQSYTPHLTSTILAFKNTLDWMAYEEDLVEMSGGAIAAPRQ